MGMSTDLLPMGSYSTIQSSSTINEIILDSSDVIQTIPLHNEPSTIMLVNSVQENGEKESIYYLTSVSTSPGLYNGVEMNSINLIQLPNPVNIIQLTNNAPGDGLVLCLPPEYTIVDGPRDKAQSWYKDSQLTIRALSALNSNTKNHS